jgi:hypothetical protein
MLLVSYFQLTPVHAATAPVYTAIPYITSVPFIIYKDRSALIRHIKHGIRLYGCPHAGYEPHPMYFLAAVFAEIGTPDF